jgi:hypothetical protein
MAWRRRRIEKRGRPRKPPVRAAPEPDKGTSQLRRKKRQVTTRDNVELTAAGVLFGRGLIDAEQFDRLGEVTETLRLLARNLGPRPSAVAGLWQSLTGAMIGIVYQGVPSSVGPLAAVARSRLRQMLSKLDGSRDLVVAIARGDTPPLVEHALAGRLTTADQDALDRLKAGLDRLAARGRPRR